MDNHQTFQERCFSGHMLRSLLVNIQGYQILCLALLVGPLTVLFKQGPRATVMYLRPLTLMLF